VSLQNGGVELSSVLQHDQLRDSVNVVGRQRLRSSLRPKGNAQYLGTQQHRSNSSQREQILHVNTRLVTAPDDCD
jgi:hypothetical protein